MLLFMSSNVNYAINSEIIISSAALNSYKTAHMQSFNYSYTHINSAIQSNNDRRSYSSTRRSAVYCEWTLPVGYMALGWSRYL